MGRYVTLGQNASAREQTSFSAKSRDEQLIYMDFEVAVVKSVNYNPGDLDTKAVNEIEFERVGAGNQFNDYPTAIPLLRGTIDQPVSGDVVLIYNIVDDQGEDNFFYLGPVNTENNPTINPTVNANSISDIIDSTIETTQGNQYHNANYRIDFLDLNYKHKGKLASKLDYNDRYEDLYESNKPNSGDLILTGRYGNSIRLGARADNPITIISSGQQNYSISEHLNDKNIILMSTAGTVGDHLTLESNNESEEIRYPLDNSDNTRHINFADENIYDYNSAQMFLKSDRITLATGQDKILLLSGKGITLNGLENINIGTKQDIILDSETVLLGGVTDGITESGNREQAVLGNQLVGILEEILDLLGQLSDSYQVPLTDAKATPAATTTNLIKNKLTNILSEHIYIKRNQVK